MDADAAQRDGVLWLLEFEGAEVESRWDPETASGVSLQMILLEGFLSGCSVTADGRGFYCRSLRYLLRTTLLEVDAASFKDEYDGLRGGNGGGAGEDARIA